MTAVLGAGECRQCKGPRVAPQSQAMPRLGAPWRSGAAAAQRLGRGARGGPAGTAQGRRCTGGSSSGAGGAQTGRPRPGRRGSLLGRRAAIRKIGEMSQSWRYARWAAHLEADPPVVGIRKKTRKRMRRFPAREKVTLSWKRDTFQMTCKCRYITRGEGAYA